MCACACACVCVCVSVCVCAASLLCIMCADVCLFEASRNEE